MRRHASDKNQEAIVKALRKLGASVVILSQVAGGCPDLLIGYRAQTFLIEVKNGSKLTTQQQIFHDTWSGGKLHVASTIEEVLRICLTT